MIACAALIGAAPLAPRAVAIVLTGGALAYGAVSMLQTEWQRPDVKSAAELIDREAEAGDVVLDAVWFAGQMPEGYAPPAFVLTLDAHLDAVDDVPPTADSTTLSSIDAAEETAAGLRLWIVGSPALVRHGRGEPGHSGGRARDPGGLRRPGRDRGRGDPDPGCRGWRLVTQGAGSERAAPLSAAIALSVCVALATFGVLAPLVHWAVPATELPPPFTEQHQDAETLLFILAFAFALPLSLFAGPRAADRIAAGPNAGAVGGTAVLALALLFGAIVFVKFSEHLPWGAGLGTLFVASVAWFLLAGVLVARLASPRPIAPSAARLLSQGRELHLLAGLLAFGVALSFARLGSIAVVPLIVGLIVAGGAALADRVTLSAVSRPAGIAWGLGRRRASHAGRPQPRDPTRRIPRWRTRRTSSSSTRTSSSARRTRSSAADAMLVDTLSQYGVGSIYFLAGLVRAHPDRQRHARPDRGGALGRGCSSAPAPSCGSPASPGCSPPRR